MLFWTKFPFIRITTVFALGIWAGNYIPVPLQFHFVLWIIFCLLFFLVSRHFIREKFRKFNLSISFLAFFTLFLFGILLMQLQKNQQEKTEKIFRDHPIECYLVRVLFQQGKTDQYQKTTAKVSLVKSDQEMIRLSGKILLYIPDEISVHYGDQLVVHGKPAPFNDPAFPDEFNYKDYMQRKGIIFHHFLGKEDFIMIQAENSYHLMRMADTFREGLVRKIHERIRDLRVQALMIALTTGLRDYFDQETYNHFIGAGIVHILAVSGLHVGILYFLLILLTRPLSLTQTGRWIRLIIILPFFLFFALVTGLSPSVLRSVVMFSIMLIGTTLDRKTPILNSVFLSAFLLLCFDPGLLWQVGFQLSYSAVLGIILFQPLLQTMWAPRLNFVRWTWDLVTVSISAQLATLPLSLLYFKQFPVYFLISNLFAIPFVTLFIPGTLVFISTYYLESPNQVVSQLLDLTGRFFIQMIQLINGLPGSLIAPVNIGSIEALLIFVMISILFIVLRYRKYRIFKYVLFILIFMVVKDAFHYFHTTGEKKIWVYSVANSPVMELVDGHHSIIIVQSPDNDISEKVRYHTENYHIHQNIRSRIIPIHNLYDHIPCIEEDGFILIFWNGKSIGIINDDRDLKSSLLSHYPLDFLFVTKNHRYEPKIPNLFLPFTESASTVPYYKTFKKKNRPRIDTSPELICITL